MKHIFEVKEQFMANIVSIETRVNTVAKNLASGKKRGEIFRMYGQKWKVSIKTIDKYITAARQKVTKKQKIKEKAENDALYETTKDLETRRILNRNERMEILSKIALGEIIVPEDELKYDPKTKKFVPTKRYNKPPSSEAIKAAINELNKMDGNHAPVETNLNATIKDVKLVLPEGIILDFPSNTE